MRRAIAILFLLASCAPARGTRPQAPAAPDDGILRVIGRLGAAHACPISETLALTSAHVADPRWFDRETPALPLTWSDAQGREGVLEPLAVSLQRDLALMESNRPFASWYAIAPAPPTVGELLRTLGYDWRSRRKLFAPRWFMMTALRIVARNVILEPLKRSEPIAIDHGASGSCVLNAREEVVAITAWGPLAEDQLEAGVAVGVWGETFGRQ